MSMFRDKRDRTRRGSTKEHEVSLRNILVKNEVEVVAQWLHDVDIATIRTENSGR
jgi:hypothetical protein